jgi:hypothetical protein
MVSRRRRAARELIGSAAIEAIIVGQYLAPRSTKLIAPNETVQRNQTITAAAPD